MMKVPVIHLLLLNLLTKGVSGNITYIAPIKSLIALLNVPVKLTFLICWNYETRYQFFSGFNQPIRKQGRSYQIRLSSDNVNNLPDVVEEFQHIIIVDLNCNTTSNFLKKVSLIKLQNFKWLAISPNDRAFKKAFDDFPMLIHTDVYCMVETKSEFLIKEVYRRSPSSDINLKVLALYRNDTMKDLGAFSPKVQRRKNLSGTILRASMVVTNNDTLNHLHDYKDKHIDTITKVNYLLTCYLMEYFNATVNYTFVNQWGYLDNQTKRWSGMIGDLVQNRSDIGATALFFTSDRVKYIDYIAMPTPTLSKFVFRSPKLSYTDDVFLLPFDKVEFVWYCLIAVFIVSALVLVVTVIVEWNLISRTNDVRDASVLKPSIHETLILVLAATCQQGSAVAPKSLTARIVMVVTYITLMFLYTSYSANIVALLQSPSTKIQTLEDLLHSRLKFGADDTIFNRYYFVHASEPTRRLIYEQKILQKNGSANFMPLAEGVEEIRHGLFAFHMELGVGYKIMSETYLEHEKCGLQEIQYLQVIDPWYAIQKNSSYKELLKTGMMLLHEYGLQNRENNRLYTKRPQCASGGGKFVTASIVDIQSALLLLVYGYIAAILILILEKSIHTSFAIITQFQKHFQSRLEQ